MFKRSFSSLICAVLCAALVLGCAVFASAEDAAVTGTFTICNYNVAGLPSLSDSSAKAAKEKRLGATVAADGWDIVTVQEDFGYSDDFGAGLSYAYRTRGAQNAVFGDGLNVFSKRPVYNVARQAWRTMGGRIWEGDIVSRKGIMSCVAEIGDGVYADVFVLHADAFDGEQSREARHDNYMQACELINADKSGRPIIVLGDFNCSFHFRNEHLYEDMCASTGLKAAWIDVENGGSYTDFSSWSGDYWGHWDSVEHILYKDGDNVKLTPTAHSYKYYVDSDGSSFSDHAAAIATFTYTATGTSDASGLVPAGRHRPNIIEDLRSVFSRLAYVFSHWDDFILMIKYRDNTEYLYTNYPS